MSLKKETKRQRFEEFKYGLPIICGCDYPMKCIARPDMVIDKNIITTEYLELATTGLTVSPIEKIEIDLDEYILYECINCLRRIKVGNYD